MSTKLKSAGSETQTMTFYCAQTGDAFSVLFARYFSRQRFRIHAIEPPRANRDQPSQQTFLKVQVKSNIKGESKSFDANDFDMAGWQCACCQHRSWPQYVKCSNCNRLVCGSKTISINNGLNTFQCATDCDAGGIIEGQISTYNVELDKTKEEDLDLANNSDMLLSARATD
jgi:hypothetical protein